MSDLHDDLMVGAKPIAKFLFGSDDKRAVRKTYRLAQEVPEEERLPTFRLGGQIAARKTTLLQHIEQRERAGRAA